MGERKGTNRETLVRQVVEAGGASAKEVIPARPAG